MFFFFQAEDGIRDGHVTGVQTCALPICKVFPGKIERQPARLKGEIVDEPPIEPPLKKFNSFFHQGAKIQKWAVAYQPEEIGRASCRERVKRSEGDGTVKQKKGVTAVARE